MDPKIRKIIECDIPAVIELMREFAEFENLAQFCEVTEEMLFAAMFVDDSYVEGLIAEDGSAAVGYALYYPNFASFRGHRGLYLEDIYLRAEFRGRSTGRAMLKEIARAAASRGFERIDFQVLEWNRAAIEFYTRLGASRDADERHFKFTDNAFDRLAS